MTGSTRGIKPRAREHPYQVSRLEELPPALQRLVDASPHLPEPLDKILVIPPQEMPRSWGGRGGMVQVPYQALQFTTQGVYHLLEGKSAAEPGSIRYLQGADLLYAHLSIVLLYGRMELCAAVDDRQERIVVEYNTVSHELLQPALNRFLRLAWAGSAPPQATTDRTAYLLYELGQLSYKFRSGMEIYCLQPTEQLQRLVFQPRIVRKYLGLVRRPVAPGSLLALSDKQLILVTEGLTNPTIYGYFITFCPLANIQAMDTRPQNSLQEVRLSLQKGKAVSEHNFTATAEIAQDCLSLWSSKE
jgi:hypothetical protein